MSVEEKFRRTIKRYSLIKQKDSILIALSGGPDSTLLVHLLKQVEKELSLKLSAIYINHQIRKQAAKQEEKFCRQLCESYQIELHIVTADIPALAKKKKTGIEETGRHVRYEIFEKYTQDYNYDKVALGHHADDRIETILFRIFRGTGKLGLIGMQAKRDRYIRPLYECTKEDILSYLEKHNISYCQDKSNRDNKFSRNFIRNELLPLLKEKLNRSVETALLNLSETVAEEEKYLVAQTDKKFKQIVTFSRGKKPLLNVKKLQKTDLWLRRRIYRNLLDLFEFTTVQRDKETIDMIDTFLHSSKSAISLPGKIQMRKIDDETIALYYSKRITFSRILKIEKPVEIVPLNYMVSAKMKKRSEIKLKRERLSFLGQFDTSKLTPPFTIRTIQQSDRFSPLGLTGHKKVGDYLTDRKISPVFRDEIPVVTDKHGIFWLVGFEIDNRVKIDEHTKEVLEIEFITEK